MLDQASGTFVPVAADEYARLFASRGFSYAAFFFA